MSATPPAELEATAMELLNAVAAELQKRQGQPSSGSVSAETQAVASYVQAVATVALSRRVGELTEALWAQHNERTNPR